MNTRKLCDMNCFEVFKTTDEDETVYDVCLGNQIIETLHTFEAVKSFVMNYNYSEFYEEDCCLI